ncbi:MAG: cytochrome b5 domain-containing protein [Candidatus Pacebacteria bacterium]|nr:cytochrome b5 domain-containing protein [Candidatus Paceibacterota bacterium]
MVSIVGLGFAEVKYQAHGGNTAFAAEQEIAPDVSDASLDTTGLGGATDTQVESTNTAGAGISRAVAKVTAAYSGRWDDDDSDEDAKEDEDEDEDSDDDSRSAPAATVATQPAAAKPTNTPPAPTATPSTAGTYTMAQIATHNSAASCYSAISGNVYDLTSFVSQHPGGAAAIKSLCGVDGTAAYSGQHGSSRRPANELAGLKIGVLVN